MATCSRCHTEKPTEDFYKTKTGHHSWCKACHKTHSKKAWDSGKKHAYDIAYRPKHVFVARKSWLKRQYGITPEHYEEMLSAQDGACKICGTKSPGGHGDRMHVDHDHSTGKIRGLLCTRCNRGIGYLRDDPARLLAAIAYLKKGGE